MINTSIPSPFKFLDAYQPVDSDNFFGRNKETRNLIEAFRKSSLVVLYGPSGSGKTSLIKCGFLKELKLKASDTREIRRGNQGIIFSIAKSLFPLKEEAKKRAEFVEIIEQINELIKKNKGKHKEIQEMDEAITQIEASYQRGEITKEELKKEIVKLQEKQLRIRPVIKGNKEERKKKEKVFLALFHDFRQSINTIPYLIFDQFEEIFTAGKEKEERQFGVFLSLIYNNNLSVKLLLSLREEYFVKLKRFEKFLPQILYRNCLVDNPTEKTVFKIIEKSFEQFEINQRYDVRNDPNRGIIDKEEQESRINKIIDQLKKKDHNSNRIHLPFLQIYLDKLYKEDFKNAYPDKKTEKKPDGTYLPLEFELDEIEQFGNIQKILNDYIKEINENLLRGEGRLKARMKAEDNVVVKFLRNYRNNDNTKKRIPTDYFDLELTNVPNEGLSYLIKNESVNKQIQLDIWGEEDNEKYNPEINTILRRLIKHRLLKYNDGYTELNHDILAVIINDFTIERTLGEILRDRFNTHFEEFENSGNNFELYLTETDAARYNEEKVLNIILEDADEEREKRKKKYWAESIKRIKDKKALEAQKIQEENLRKLKEKETQIKKLKARNNTIKILAILAMVAFGIVAKVYYDLKESHKEIGTKTEELNTEVTKSKTLSQIHGGAGTAFKNMKTNRTETFKTIDATEKSFFENLLAGIFGKEKKPTFIGDFKNELYRDFNKYPFYSKKIVPQKENISPVILTKYLLDKANKDSVHIYFLTEKKDLFEAITNYKTGDKIIVPQKLDSNVDAFELYYNPYNKNEVSLLAIKNNQLFKKEQGEPTLKLIKGNIPALINTNALVKLKDKSFVTYSDHQIVKFNLVTKDSVDRIVVEEQMKIRNSFIEIKDIKKYQDKYLLLTKKGFTLYPTGKGIYTNKKTQTTEFINSINISNKGNLFVSIKEKVAAVNGSGILKDIKHNHDDIVTSVDYLEDKKLSIYGSRDRSASIWKNNKEQKILLGHTDRITYTAILDEQNGEYVLTASADGTIKVWDLRPMDRRAIKIKEADKITKLKCLDNKLYAGFIFKNYQHPEGYMYSFCNSLLLNDSCATKYYQITKREWNDNKGHITSFGFGENNLLLASGFENKLVAAVDNKNVRIQRKKGYPTIFDIDVRKRNVAMATKKGLIYIEDYLKFHPDSTKQVLERLEFNSVDIHPTKNLVLAAAENGILYLWDVDNQKITDLDMHLDKVKDAEFSESGDYIVSGSWDNTAIIWQYKDGNYELIQRILAHTNDIEDVEFYQDSLLLTASSDQTVQIFQLTNSEEQPFEQIPSLIRHDAKITAATFSTDGQYIYSGDAKGNIKKWAFRDFEKDIRKRIEGE